MLTPRNGQRAVVGRIEHVYLTVGGGRRKGGRQVPTGRSDVGAVIAVAARCREEGAGRRGLRGARPAAGKRAR